MYIHTHNTHTLTHVHLCTHTHTHIHTHTHTHTNTLTAEFAEEWAVITGPGFESSGAGGLPVLVAVVDLVAALSGGCGGSVTLHLGAALPSNIHQLAHGRQKGVADTPGCRKHYLV